MEDLEDPIGSPSLQNGEEEPQGNQDPGDTLQPDIEEEDNTRTPPFADPSADMEARDDDEAPETVEAMDDANDNGNDDDNDDDDAESDLEELDEAQFDNFDPETANITVPVAVDESNVGLLGVHKRKRTEAEESERKKKKKEGRREKPKKAKRVRAGGDDDEDDFEGGPELDGKRQRKSKPLGPDGKPIKMARRPRTPENEDDLSPEERRRRALDRKMDEALRTNKPARRGRGGIDLEAAGDAELEQMRQRMADACQRDAAARAKGEVATHKLKLLPEVTELLNRNTLRGSIVDPDINILEAVRFFLEPADVDAALPNYQIQRELFAILGKLNMTKEALIASGIGKVILFYTKSTQPQLQIKRAAEKLTGEWMRVVLGKRKDMRAKVVPTATYDPLSASQRPTASQLPDRSAMAAEKRRQKLAVPVAGNRARVEGTLGSYSVMPANNLSNVVNVDSRRMGAAGDKVFKRMIAKGPKGK